MQNSLDDIFGSSPPLHDALHDDHHQPPTATAPPQPPTEPSDLPSLRRQHVTAGYRDGLAAAKSTQVQAGFDAGFPVGAQLGLRVGTVLGVLEGAIRGLEAPTRKGVRKIGGGAASSSTTSPGSAPAAAAAQKVNPGRDTAAMGIGFEFEDDAATGAIGEGGVASTTVPTTAEPHTPREKKRAELLGLYRRAVRELEIRKVFEGVSADSDDLSGDGGDLPTSLPQTGQKPQEMPETQLARKAEEVISAWERRVQVALWEENMDALELKEVSG